MAWKIDNKVYGMCCERSFGDIRILIQPDKSGNEVLIKYDDPETRRLFVGSIQNKKLKELSSAPKRGGSLGFLDPHSLGDEQYERFEKITKSVKPALSELPEEIKDMLPPEYLSNSS